MKIGNWVGNIEENFDDNDEVNVACSTEVSDLLFNTYVGYDARGCDEHFYQIRDYLIQNENR